MRKLLISQCTAAACGALGALYATAAMNYFALISDGRLLASALLGGLVIVLIGCGVATAKLRESPIWMATIQIITEPVYLVLLAPVVGRLLPSPPSPGRDLGGPFLFILVFLGSVGSMILGSILGAVLGPVWRRRAQKA